MRRVTALLILPLLTACDTPPAPVVVLDEPEAQLTRTLQQVSNVVELRDGRVAFAELADRSFLYADLATGDITPVGEHADTIGPSDPAPGKHKYPGYVFRLGGDTVGLVDFAAERTTLWDDQGQFLLTLDRRGVGGHNQPLAYDHRGNAYKEDVRSVLGGLEPGEEIGLDSLEVLRIARGDSLADTVAQLKLPVWGQGRFGEQMKMVSTIFSGRDLFGVLPDGSLWVARASDNSVDWRAPDGKWSRGGGRPFTPIAVPPEEKEMFLDRLRAQMTRTGAPAGIALSYPFADQKPPFVAGATNPAGEVWLQRARAFEDSVPVWDVVGRDGKSIRTVEMPKGASLGGFGADGRVYLLLRQPDGRQGIGRYRLK
ncbi:MAG: hypothetical protein OEW17_00205 [Gemmatimonadota bacterium]|nr:hypothetical protein [Gemmatimonadota bacterium]MDH4347201.1 hypothetical protein [Gemmatimonadota bacterium]MDH5282266.1 hypothetical protein [Gemmatimonadota bacterium]